MGAHELLVVIVAYKNTGSLEEAIRSLGPGKDVLVVDNGVDREVEAVTARYGARYTTPGSNVGFAAGVNVALNERAGRHVLLLNPDARVTPDLPRQLVDVLERDPRIAAVAPRIEYPDGTEQQVVWPIPSPTQEWTDALKLGRFFRSRDTFLIGAVLLLRSEAMDEIGLFDERFFLYAEECDWQLRALRRGWKVHWAAHLRAEHEGAGSSEHEPVRRGFAYESAALFGRKWYGNSGWGLMRAGSFVGTLLRLMASVRHPDARTRYLRELRH